MSFSYAAISMDEDSAGEAEQLLSQKNCRSMKCNLV